MKVPSDYSDAASSMTYFITGVSRGLGEEMARQLVADGHRVIGTVRPTSCPPKLSGEVSLVELDVNELDGFALSTPIDVLINNAGVSDSAQSGVPSPELGQLTAPEIEHVLRTNLVSPLLLTQALLPNLLMRSTRRVVFVSSDLGSIACNTTGGRHSYRASKAGLNMVSKTLSVDLSPQGFTVVAIEPGWVRTEMGGEAAPLGVTESVTAVLRTIASLSVEQNGSFLDRNGGRVRW